jgi:multidrug efflux pump subunit AcrA (membrane-fusion protein)
MIKSKTFPAIVFLLLAVGGIFTVTRLIKPASVTSMEGMPGMESMSMEEMMRVDGSVNPTPVTVATVQSSNLTATVRYTGTVRPYQEVTVYPRVQGRLTDYAVYPGDRVVQGQVLAKLSAEELATTADAAQAEITTAQAELQSSRAELAEHEQEIAQMQADYGYWAKELPRAQVLLTKGVISQEEFDKEKSQADVAQALLRGVERKRLRLQAQVQKAQAMVAQARAKSRSAGIMQSYTIITAPITGIVQERLVDPGVVVQPGMGILKIGDYQRVRLQTNVTPQDLTQIQIGTPITARIPGQPRAIVQGNITSIFPQAGVETRTITIESVVNNDNSRLKSGQFLEMELITGRKSNVLTIPKVAIQDNDGKSTVWLLAGKFAQRQPVTLGLISGENVEVVSGLAPGARVIVTGQQGLTASTKVAAVDESGQPLMTLGETKIQGNTRIQVVSAATKPQMGDNTLLLEVQDAKTGQPLEVEKLEVTIAMPMKNMAAMTAETEVKPTGKPGQFKVDTYLSMEGAWEVTAKIEDKTRQGNNQFTLDNRQEKR